LQGFALGGYGYSPDIAPGTENEAICHQQLDKLSGKVVDEHGTPVPGVTVAVKGTSIGTTTDDDGNYVLQVEKGQTLVFSSIGYKRQEIQYNGQSHINTTLEASSTQLNEVVTVGYGIQKKASVVGAIGQISGDAILKQDVPEVANALAGLLPGLETIQSSSLPGGSGENDNATKIYIRGRSTWNAAQPLVLVDGVERSIDDIDPYEIDKISILKDASATAVFGVKGANGVILITTKRGKLGKVQLNLDAQATMNVLSRQPNVLGSYDGNVLRNEAILNEVGVSPSSWSEYKPQQVLNYYKTQEYPDLFPDVNWLDEFTKDYAMSSRANFNIRGGTKFVKYFGSLSYLHQGGLIATKDYGQGYNPSYNYDRFNFRSNLDFDITRTTRLSVNLSGMYGIQKSPNGNNTEYATFWKSLYGHPPDVYPVRYSDGTWGENLAFDKYLNGLTAVNFHGVKSDNRTRITTDLKLDQKLDFITPGLSLGGRLSLDNYFLTEGPDITDDGVVTKYMPPSLVGLPKDQWDQYAIYNYPAVGEANGYNYTDLPNRYANEESLTQGQSRATDYQVNLNYARTLGDHDVSGLFLVKRRESAGNQDFLSYEEDWVGRLTYSYLSKYLVEFNGAYTGSEKFSRKYRFGFFPSVGLGWVISEEKFFRQALPFIDQMKFRYSDGKVGNDQGIARWQYVSNWDPLTNTWRFGSPYLSSTGLPITLEGAIANPDIHWETDHKQNFGLDAAFLRSDLTLSFNYFWDTNSDIFVSAAQRTGNDIFGAPLPSANIGETKTHGWELDLQYRHHFNNRVSIKVRYTQSFVKNLVMKRDDPALLPNYQKQAGFPIGKVHSQVNQPGEIQSWDQVYTGVLGIDNTQRLPGDFRQIDFNADGVVDQNDRVPYGYSGYPQYTHSLMFEADYKGFNARILFYGAWNVSLPVNYSEFNEGYTIIWGFQANTAWNPEAGRTTSATYPGLRLYTSSSKGNWSVEDGSYTRIKSAELGYNFNKRILKKLKLSSLQIFLRGYNLALWSKMREDREAQSGGIAIRTLSYPLTKNYTLGLSLGF
jgi:TonB-linked SusC/RagA family outer membrane protein